MSLTTPPVAPKKPHAETHHGITVTDDYAWLRDPGYPEVKDPAILAHLEAENAWFEAAMAPHQSRIDALFAEMRGRIKEADKSVPQKDGDWLYWIEFEEGAEYKKWWRRPVSGGPDELILDEVALAEGCEYFRLGAIAVSNDGTKLAWSVDDSGSERFTARIKVIATGEVLPDEIPGTLSGLIWVAGDTGLVYSLANEQWRTDNARLHWLGQPNSSDVELYHEDDEGFRVGASLSAN
jgi:oligopeptidase B